MFLHHLFSRVVSGLRSPGTLLLYTLAGAASLILWPWLVDPTALGETGYDLLILFMTICLWPMFLLLLASGRTLAGSLLDGLTSVPLPGLPIGLASRTLAESLAALLLVLAVRIPFLFLDGPAMESYFLIAPVAQGEDARVAYATVSAIGTLVSLPVLLAWMVPTSNRIVFLVRPLAVSGLLTAALAAGLGARPLLLSAVCVVLSAVVVLFPAFEPGIRWGGARRRSTGRRPVALRRAYRNPSVQLRRDMLLGPFRGWWPLLFVLLVADAVAVVLARDGTISSVARYGAASAMWGSVWGAVVFRPFGIPLIGRSGRTAGGGERAGAFLAAWSVRPVRPASVLRMVYAHGLVLGVGLTALGAAHMWMTTALGVGLEEDFQRRFLLSMLAISPCVSGFLVATAVGSTFLGAVSFVSGIAILPVHLFLMVSRTWRSLDLSDESRAALHVAALLVLAAIGGLPPLRYLRAGTADRNVDSPKGQAHA